MPRIRAFLRNRRAPSKGLQSPLTRRETDILSLIAESVGNAEIGERLHLGLGTVKGHVADILSNYRPPIVRTRPSLRFEEV